MNVSCIAVNIRTHTLRYTSEINMFLSAMQDTFVYTIWHKEHTVIGFPLIWELSF